MLNFPSNIFLGIYLSTYILMHSFIYSYPERNKQVCFIQFLIISAATAMTISQILRTKPKEWSHSHWLGLLYILEEVYGDELNYQPCLNKDYWWTPSTWFEVCTMAACIAIIQPQWRVMDLKTPVGFLGWRYLTWIFADCNCRRKQAM